MTKSLGKTQSDKARKTGAKKRGRGRPPVDPSLVRSVRLPVRLTPGELVLVEQRARAAGCETVTDWVRSRLLR